jgi:hypothetical protein
VDRVVVVLLFYIEIYDINLVTDVEKGLTRLCGCAEYRELRAISGDEMVFE